MPLKEPAGSLSPTCGRSLFFVVVIEQVSHTAELFSGSLQSFDLLAELRLLRLFLAQHLVDIPHAGSLLIEL